jgi:hypothetical protein
MVVPSVAALDGHVSDCLRSRMRRRTGKLEGVDSFSFNGCSCNPKLLTWEIWGSRANLSGGWIRPCGNKSDDFALVTSAPVLADEARHLKSLSWARCNVVQLQIHFRHANHTLVPDILLHTPTKPPPEILIPTFGRQTISHPLSSETGFLLTKVFAGSSPKSSTGPPRISRPSSRYLDCFVSSTLASNKALGFTGRTSHSLPPTPTAPPTSTTFSKNKGKCFCLAKVTPALICVMLGQNVIKVPFGFKALPTMSKKWVISGRSRIVYSRNGAPPDYTKS